MGDSVTSLAIGRAPNDATPAACEGPAAPATVGTLADADDAARGYANRSRSDGTWRAYEADWRAFTTWCAEAALSSLPAEPRTVARFLAVQACPTAERPAGRAVSTLRRRLAAIRLMHLGARHVSPHAAPDVTEVLRGIARDRRDVPTDKKRPVLDRDVRGMVDAFDIDSLAGLRDRALLLLGFAGALRRSELVGLDIDDLERREEGFLVTVRHSKADQVGAGQRIAVPARPGSRYCPVAAVEAWQLAAGIRSGPLFRRFWRGDVPSEHRLSAQTVTAVVKRGAVAIGRDPTELAAHSLRHGFLTQAARNGSNLFRMAAQSRHRDVRTVMSYVEEEARFEGHPGHGMLAGPSTTETTPTPDERSGRATRDMSDS